MVAELKKIFETLCPQDVHIMDQEDMQLFLKKIIVTIKDAQELKVPERREECGDERLVKRKGCQELDREVHRVHVERGRKSLAQHRQEDPEPQW